MMYNQPSDPEYCQGIYEAAKKVVHTHNKKEYRDGLLFYLLEMDVRIDNLKRALEGKP